VSLGSVAGFALVFVVCAWALSSIGGLVLHRSRRWLQRQGPMAERRAAEAVAVVPVVLAAVAVATLVLQSALGVDHCEAHDHHAHLCITHGAAWLERTSAMVTLAVAGAAMLVRLVLLVTSFARGARSIRELHALSRDAGDVRIVDSDRPFCFVAGPTRPAIYVSSRVWSALSEAERSALVAHERAHVRHGDLYLRVALEVFLVAAAPLVGDRVRAMWLHAGERLCDAHAATVTGEPANVASAMVALCRLNTPRPVASLGFTPTADELAGRVQAVLEGRPTGHRTAARLGRAVLTASLIVVGATIVASEPLHHVFETLLG